VAGGSISSPILPPGESKQKEVRCFDNHEDDPLDEAQFAAGVRRINMSRRLCGVLVSAAALAWAGAFLDAAAGDAGQITITTWNIEILGGEGRGFADGFGKGQLGPRTADDLAKIADLIKNTLGSDILAVQEVSITSKDDSGRSRCQPLDAICTALGGHWHYFIQDVDDIPEGHDNLFCAFVWNGNRVRKLAMYPMSVPNLSLTGANLFDRRPLVGYFEVIHADFEANDFALVNVHLKSGQDFDENHLIAMTIIEHGLTQSLKGNKVTESDRIILGDFNDNPYAKANDGEPKFSPALYTHMRFKGYKDLVTEKFHATRMDLKLTSIIDHILVNRSARRHMNEAKAGIFVPAEGDSSKFADWRRTYSDHFPISFKLKIGKDDDADFGE
jgi:endonuclease/exonuclease/phosphatase family metal-dependent hydrolase